MTNLKQKYNIKISSISKSGFLLLAWIFSLSSCIAQSQNYVVPATMTATAYPAHVELNWKNIQVFTYDIYCSKDAGKTFELKTETTSDYYLDFVGKATGKEQKLIYRIVPKGLSVKDKNSAKFEVSTTIKPSTNDELLDMVQRYTTRYFYDFADPVTGMARERSNDVNGNIVTTGGTGFGIMALVAGAERHYFSREQALGTISKIVTFLEKAERFHTLVRCRNRKSFQF